MVEKRCEFKVKFLECSRRMSLYSSLFLSLPISFSISLFLSVCLSLSLCVSLSLNNFRFPYTHSDARMSVQR